MEKQINLDSVVELFKKELSDVLIGIYLHGSMAMKCFNPSHSDIDLLIITRDKSPIETYQRIAKQLIVIEEEEIKIAKGLELSIILERNFKDFVYPTPFEFHYSAFHKERYKNEEFYFCGGYDDPDLAAHFVVAYNRGITLYGRPFNEIFNLIDKKYYVNSITSDVKNAQEEIVDNPIYYVLNLCRALQYLHESTISSKKEGGEWALGILPKKYVDLVDKCLASYNNASISLELNNQFLLDFAEYMINNIDNSKLNSRNEDV
ncbi:aminoglycoside adenylyltransferase domain-containing protein [Paenibacillus crassostreae]|uniref:Spectinomycin 9-adenylyltransferase n=1 Tax=Paenibacillus crassostreae TaxID=1763538 RepID=A0A167FC71_9BACL|nr:hypothetical protein LPB68_00520 [Paenibacillus crassostreae]OAB76400.1 DNA polymerase [Paenibacillus crassostreae]